MKKYLYRIFIIIIILFTITIGKSYGFMKEDIEENIQIWSHTMTSNQAGIYQTETMEQKIKSNLLQILKGIFNYDQGTINEYMKFDTKIEIKSKKNDTYTIQIGNTYEYSSGYYLDCTISGISEEDLKNIYGCANVKEGEKWDAVLIVQSDEESDVTFSGVNYNLVLDLNAIYAKTGDNAGKDYNSGRNLELDSDEMHFAWEMYSGGTIADIGEEISEVAEKWDQILNEILAKVLKNPMGTALSYFFGLLRDGLGDSMQKIANTITFSDIDITYSREEITAEGSEISIYNEYVNVTDYSKRLKSDNENQKIINIDKIDSSEEEDKRFNEDTEIPLITIDIFSIAADNVPFFDINFLVVDKEKHTDNTTWTNIRNFVTTIIHITIYIVATYLIVMLIFNGIRILTHTLDNPGARAQYKQGLQKFAMSLIMLIGTIVIMALCIFGSNMFLDEIKVNDTNEFPIRVNVEEAGYSFSTNITGFFRYMAEIEGVNRCLEKGVYTVAYIAVAFVNLVIASFMIIRMLGMMILAIIGPIIVVLYALNVKSPIKYSTWVRLYVCLAAVQLIFAIVYQVIFGFTVAINSTI